jgi:hypothetical protein
MIRETLHAFAALEPRKAYRDPGHDVKHLQQIYDKHFSRGCKDLERAQKWDRIARERLATAARVREQLDAAEALLPRGRA